MQKYQEIIKTILPKNCIWDEGYTNEFTITNCPVRYIEDVIKEVVKQYEEEAKTATIVISKLLVAMQNNCELIDTLTALLHIYQDNTFGDNVWRLMVEEKAQKLIKNATT